MNNLQIFESKEFGSIRTIEKDNTVWFVGKEIAENLGYGNTRDALATHVDEDDKRIILKSDFATLEIPNRGLTVINESGLYSLVLSSKLPSAKKFKRWITSEVLPSIRKHGAYMTEETLEKALTSPDFLISLATKLKAEQEKNKQLAEKVAEMKPKEIFADAVSTSQTSILVGDLAKLICQNGVQIGQKRLFSWLRDNGYLIKSGNSKNMPKQRYMDQGLFEVKESSIQNPDGSVRITKTTKVSGKGQIYFVNKFVRAEC